MDGKIGFTGGLNISDDNVMATKPKEPVQDTHFRIDGPVVCQLTEAFIQDWSFATDEDLDGDAWFPDIDGPGNAPARVIDSGPRRRHREDRVRRAPGDCLRPGQYRGHDALFPAR